VYVYAEGEGSACSHKEKIPVLQSFLKAWVCILVNPYEKALRGARTHSRPR